jgi:hypothetical protein
MADLLSYFVLALPVSIAFHVWMASDDDEKPQVSTRSPSHQGGGDEESKTSLTQGLFPHESHEEDRGFEVIWRGSLIATTSAIMI